MESSMWVVENEINTFDILVSNVGSGKSTGVTEILSLLYSRLDSIPFDTKVSRKSLHADWSKIQAACGWEPKVDLREGVNRFIDWRERQ